MSSTFFVNFSHRTNGVNSVTTQHQVYIQPLKDLIDGSWSKTGIEALISCYALYNDHMSWTGNDVNTFVINGSITPSELDIDFNAVLKALNSDKYSQVTIDDVTFQFKFDFKEFIDYNNGVNGQPVNTGQYYFSISIEKIIKRFKTTALIYQNSSALEKYIFALQFGNHVFTSWGQSGTPVSVDRQFIISVSLNSGIWIAKQKYFATSLNAVPSVFSCYTNSSGKGSVTADMLSTDNNKKEATFTNYKIPIMICYDAIGPGEGYATVQLAQDPNSSSIDSPIKATVKIVPSTYLSFNGDSTNTSVEPNNNYSIGTVYTINQDFTIGDTLADFWPDDPLRSNVVNNIELSTTQLDLVTGYSTSLGGINVDLPKATVLEPDPDSTGEVVYTSNVPQLR